MLVRKSSELCVHFMPMILIVISSRCVRSSRLHVARHSTNAMILLVYLKFKNERMETIEKSGTNSRA